VTEDSLSTLPVPRLHDVPPTNFWQKLYEKIPAAKWESVLNAENGSANQHERVVAIAAASPFLAQLMSQYPELLLAIFESGLEAIYESWRTELDDLSPEVAEAELMQRMRRHKARGALIIAWADLNKIWPLSRITQALTEMAERTLKLSVNHLLLSLKHKGTLSFESVEQSGFMVLGMGKLGGHELNYSSDVDLILLFDSEKMQYHGKHSLQHILNRLAQNLIRIMQERTVDGYVFRVDLRLRPDPSSTPAVVKREAAIRYYESVGQNWERAAFTKARPVAGDLQAAQILLDELKPFIWRKNLDFASVNDINAIKQQLTPKHSRLDHVAGHNIKTGLGGIREIEFIAHSHQLIWGGKSPHLRQLSTCATLKAATESKLMKREEYEQLILHYRFLRDVEHRLQMVNDQQTHTIPKDEAALTSFAAFCGFISLDAFKEEVRNHIESTHRIYRENVELPEEEDQTLGKLVFTGVDFDESTLITLRELGYEKPEWVIEEIRKWHRGAIRATRELRARQILTKLTPALLYALSRTVSPDQTFYHFSKFLSGIPSGMQVFSLFNSYPQLMDHIARIMGYAPTLAEQFTRHPHWLEILLTNDTEEVSSIAQDPKSYLALSHHREDDIRWLCRFRNEWDFLTGTRLLQQQITPEAASRILSKTADKAVDALQDIIWERFTAKYGEIAGADFAIIALGRLGSRELTFGSDLDLIFVYDTPQDSVSSDGDKTLSPSVYFTRFFQRFMGASQALTSEGRLYEIDARLRPGGESHALAVSYDMFCRYYAEEAWTFERMALSRARIVYSRDKLGKKLSADIQNIVSQPRDRAALANEICSLRSKIKNNFGWDNIWDVKYARGGLMDITFLAQFFTLYYGAEHPALCMAKPVEVIRQAFNLSLLDEEAYHSLAAAYQFQERLLTLTRLCQQDLGKAEPAEGFKRLLTSVLEVENFSDVSKTLNHYQNAIYEIFTRHVGTI
jgi:glutamate-ammonia-ligase adenylyltransferase